MKFEVLLKREDIPEDVRDIIRQILTENIELKEKLSETEQNYKDLTDQAREIIFFVNPEGIITSINTSVKEMTGWSQEEWIGKPFSPKIHPDDINTTMTRFKEVLEGKNPSAIEIRIRNKSGDYSTFEIKGSKCMREGQVKGLLGFARNITKRKQAEAALLESEEKYRILVERAKDGITIIQDGIIKFVNQALAGMAGLKREEVLQTPFMNYIHPDALPDILIRYERRMAGQDVPSLYETTLVTNSGEAIEVEINAGLINFQNKNADLVIVRDIRDRKITEKALAESEAKNRAILDAIPDFIFQINNEGKILSYKGSLELVFIKPENFLGKYVFDVFPPKLAQKTMRFINEAFNTNTTQIFEYQLPIREEMHFYEARLVAYRKNEIIMFIRDFTQQKRVLKDLRESEERYRTLVTTMAEGVWVTDLENRTLFVNPALERMLGYGQKELLNRKVNDFIVPESISVFEDQCTKRYKNGIPTSTYELMFYRKDGSILITRVAGTGLYNEEQKITGSFGLLSDITAEKKAQEALQSSEERYRTLVELSPDAITLTDLELNIIAVNQQSVRLNGAKDADELIGCNTIDLISSEDRQIALTNARSLLEEKKVLTFEYKLLRRDGSVFPAEMNVSVIYDDKEDPKAFITITRDISERKQAEQALIDSEEKYRSLVENINSGVFRVSFDGKFLQYNRAFREMFGFDSDEEFQNLPLEELYLYPRDRYRFVEELYREGELQVTEVQMKKRDGTPFWGSISSRVSSDGSYHYGILEDITKRKLAEESFKQVKLEEERYHAMLSHFVNNDFQKIINNLELLSREYDTHHEMNKRIIRKITEIANRSSKTIDIVNKIFEVLQSQFYIESFEQKVKINHIIEEVRSDFISYHRPFNINSDNLDISIINDKYLRDIFREIFLFLLEPNGEDFGLDSPIFVDGSKFSSQFCLIIRDQFSQPVEKEMCKKLSGKITDQWEYQGHFIGIALASVIMQHYKGQLQIYPSETRGNEFQLWFPLGMFQFTENL